MFVLAFFVCSFSANAQNSTNAAETFKQYVADFQKSIDDQTLRERLVRFVATMAPKPEVPEEANRHFVKAATFMKEAKDKSDFELAISEYREALRIAPWWAEAYYNEGVAFQAAQQFDQAIAAFKLYLLSNPDDVAEAKNRIYSIEAEKELAEKRALDVATKTQEVQKAVDSRLVGTWCRKDTYSQTDFEAGAPLITISASDGQFTGKMAREVWNNTGGGSGIWERRITYQLSDFRVINRKVKFLVTSSTTMFRHGRPYLSPAGDSGIPDSHWHFDLDLSDDSKTLSGKIFLDEHRSGDGYIETELSQCN